MVVGGTNMSSSVRPMGLVLFFFFFSFICGTSEMRSALRVLSQGMALKQPGVGCCCLDVCVPSLAWYSFCSG